MKSRACVIVSVVFLCLVFSGYAKALVTVQNEGSGSMFGGVIFSKKSSGIRSIEDVRRKKIICPKFSSAGGWIFQKGVLLEAGIKPEKDCDFVSEAGTHDAAVMAVLQGKADVGTVRSNILERMQAKRKIRIGDFTIINPIDHQGFQELCSTPLYPTWPIAALKDVLASRSGRLKQALLNIPVGHPSLKPCKVTKFIEALDYQPLEGVLMSGSRLTYGDSRVRPAKTGMVNKHSLSIAVCNVMRYKAVGGTFS